MIEEILRRLSQPSTDDRRFIVVLAGPNGAGKSTFHDVYLRGLRLPLVNADLIALELAVADATARARQAAAIAEEERRLLIARGESFCMETVFSDPVGAKLDLLRGAQSEGYEIILVFVGLESPDLSLARVMQRVEQGGHDAPDDRLRARFPRVLANLKAVVTFVDLALLLDNSDAQSPYRFVALFERGKRRRKSRQTPGWAHGII